MHTHPMSNLGFGGKLIHGGPDIKSLLPVDSKCQPNVRATSIEHALGDDRSTHAGQNPMSNPCGDYLRQRLIDTLQEQKGYVTPDGALGAPDFPDWPRHDDITHQKMWVDWIERAYAGGLRVLVALAVHNQTLAALVAGKGDGPLDDKGSGDLQIKEIIGLADRHEFMEVARSPEDLRRIVQDNNHLAVVLGIELDAFGNFHKGTNPTIDSIKEELSRLYAMGVRYIFPIHSTDNKLGGTAAYEPMFNFSNYREYGEYWDLELSKPEDKIGWFYKQDWLNLLLMATTARVKLGMPVIPVPPDYPNPNDPSSPSSSSPRGHVNKKSLTSLGEQALLEMMKLGFIIDIDHMSQKSANRALEIAEDAVCPGGYPLNSGHNGPRSASPQEPNENQRTEQQLQKIAELGGMLGLGIAETTPDAFISTYQLARKEMPNQPIGIGSDFNGLVKGPPPVRGALNYTSDFVRCPKNKSKDTFWDYNVDGAAHYGMLPDFLQAVRACPDGIQVVYQLNRSADAFLRMWERCEDAKSNVK